MSDLLTNSAQHGGQLGEGYGRAKPQGADFSHGIALYLEKVSVWFDSFRALNDLSLYIAEGELRCIIGPNGAGKTTLDRKSTRLNSSHMSESRMPSSA